ncbi:MAG: CpXC domain-containing protein [Methanomicrobiales archaeon]|nr:CpXC domain-containing protein [Methanomicrobiales archaeon]
MTQIVSVQMECPRCHHTQEVEYWRSLNVTVDPDRKEKLLSGEINVFLCEQCSYRSFLAAHFLYTDMEKKFSVLLVNWELVQNDEYLKNTFTAEATIRTREGEVPIFQSLRLEYYKAPHIVFRMGDLISYILFRDKLAALHPPSEEKEG